MRRSSVKMISLLIAAVLSAAAVMSFSQILSSADVSLLLTLSTTAEEVHSGDIITVRVQSDDFPHITRFGPIEIDFDPALSEVISINPSSGLPGFVYSTDMPEDGRLLVTAIDENSETEIAENGIEENDPSYYSEEETMLFSVSFRVDPSATESVSFRIGGAFDLYMSNGELASVVIGDPIEIPIEETLSNDATLGSLGIDGVTLSPPFSSDIFDYSATVNRNVESLDVYAVASNSWASVTVSGAEALEYGDNTITVGIVAQDGVTDCTYTIHVAKQESYMTEGAGLLDAEGRNYAFVSLPLMCSVPEGFAQTEKIINGYTVPVFAKEGVASFLVYLYDGVNEPGFYFYNPSERTVTRYEQGNVFVEQSSILTICEIPDGLILPKGFYEDAREIHGQVVSGYCNDEDVFIVYMSDESGNEGFFRYDRDSDNFYDYEYYDKTAEDIYRGLFRLFVFVSAAESILLVGTIYIIRQIISYRTNPRPKRV